MRLRSKRALTQRLTHLRTSGTPEVENAYELLRDAIVHAYNSLGTRIQPPRIPVGPAEIVIKLALQPAALAEMISP